MPMDAHDIESMIKAAIPDAEVTIRDLAGTATSTAANGSGSSAEVARAAARDRLTRRSRDSRALAACAWRCRPVPEVSPDEPRRAAMTDIRHGAMFRPTSAPSSRRHYGGAVIRSVTSLSFTQISHTLLARFYVLGALQATVLFLAVWWVWVITDWITTVQSEKTPVLLLLFAMMWRGAVDSIRGAASKRGDYGSPSPMRRCRSARRYFCGCPRRRRARGHA